MAKANLSPWRLWWRKIHNRRDHGEGSSIVVDTENLNCPRPSPRGNELRQTHIFDPSQKHWRNSWSIFKISYTWNATVSVELPIYPLYRIQILAQSIPRSSRNGFTNYWLIILISISFQSYYWRSSKRKILEKSRIIATHTHCIISKFQLNSFITAHEMDFLIIGLLFSFLYLSSSVTREVVNKKF